MVIGQNRAFGVGASGDISPPFYPVFTSFFGFCPKNEKRSNRLFLRFDLVF